MNRIQLPLEVARRSMNVRIVRTAGEPESARKLMSIIFGICWIALAFPEQTPRATGDRGTHCSNYRLMSQM